jgi:hypothetical protein
MRQMLCVFVSGHMARRRLLTVLLLIVGCTSACVTQTERVGYYPHARPEEESVWGELQREFGWQKKPQTVSGEPFYQRATRGVTETVSGWFHKEEAAAPADTQKREDLHRPSEDARKLEGSRRQFEQERQEAFRRLRERQEQQD